MSYDIKITKTDNSRLSKVDFNNIPFGMIFSDHMFVADYKDGEWKNLEIKPYGPITFSPSMLALHYGQSVFEGMKASRNVDGVAQLFRPEQHAQRINRSAKRLCIPEVPEELFLTAVRKLVALDKDWIPPIKGSALYIRPFIFATDEMLGVKVSKSYKFIIFTGPVGPYYPEPIKLLAETKYVRAVRGGVGEAKAAGNYAASLLPAKLAQEKGYQQVMWMDAHDHKYVQEVGTMNLFFVIDDTIITPSADGAILKGITRDSILTLLKEGGYPHEVRKVSIDEIVDAYNSGKLQEVFGSGTAAVIANVSEIMYDGQRLVLPPVEEHKYAALLREEINGIRYGTKQDKFNWLENVSSEASVLG